MPHQMPRRQFLGYAAGAVSAAAVAPRAHAARPLNVVYLFSDEHRWQSMSFTELPEVHTPNMEALASQGVSFTNCISNYPVCSPYRAMLLTGRWPYQQGIIDNGIALKQDAMTIGKAFKAAGYTTGYIGKWHLGGVRAEPFGFDESLIWTNDNTHWDKSQYHPREGEPVQPKGYNATLETNQALEFIEKHRETPFFLMVSWNPPHSDFTDAPEEKKRLYPEGSLPYRKNVPSQSRSEIISDQQKQNEEPIWKQNSWKFYQGYHAHISAIDDELGRVMAKLDQLGLADNTILVYSSDHGSMMGSHGVGGKRQPYEESIRVPFLVRGPGFARNLTLNPLFGAIDIMPTLCGLANVPIESAIRNPQSAMGQDFSPWLRGQKGPDPEAQLIMHISKTNASGGETHPAPLFRGLRTKRYTYAVQPDKPWLLFDNQEDPYQMKDLIADASQTSLRVELDVQLAKALERARDPFVLVGK